MKKLYVLFLATVVFGFLFGLNPTSPRAADEFPTISTEELAKGIKDKSLFVVDNNRPDVFKKNHIPSAVWMNPSELDAKLLPANKNASLVFYCKNPKCGASHSGARSAQKLGYSNIRIYPQGIDGWLAAGQSAEAGH